MENAKPASSGVAIGERIERQQQARLVQAARQKLEQGQGLSTRELSAVKKFEREQLQLYGPQYLAAVPKGDYAHIVGRQPKQLIEAADRYGLPYKPHTRTVDVGRLLRWFHDFLAANSDVLVSGNADDAILQLASKDLKDEFVRKRIEEKDVDIRRKQHELAQLNESYLPIEPIRHYHNEAATLIRALRMKLAKRFEGDDKEFVEIAFDDLFVDYERLADAHFNAIDDTEHAALDGVAN